VTTWSPPPTATRGAAGPRPGPTRPPAADRLRGWLSEDQPPHGSGPPSPFRSDQILKVGLNIVAALLLALVAQVTIVGTLKHNRDQQIAYDDLRLSLAEGTTAVGPVEGKPLAKGTPIARISIPAIGLKEVVLEGTTAGVLRSGVGHRRDSVMPGQVGTSILMGHRLAYGGPFSQLADLNIGDTLEVTGGQGTAQFRVLGVRHTGAPVPGLAAGGSRLTLVTSTGNRLAPEGVVQVDADLMGAAPFAPVTPSFTAATLPADEGPMAKEPRALKYAVGWGILLVAAAVGCVWLRARWGRWQSWLVSVPALAFFGISVADNVVRLLPNLL
jgi:sortase A